MKVNAKLRDLLEESKDRSVPIWTVVLELESEGFRASLGRMKIDEASQWTKKKPH
jgi:hypothetical protein